MKSIDEILSEISSFTEKPPLFEPGEARFWDDPHISKGMLAAHLNPDNDAASRRPETIDKDVENLVSSGTLKSGDRILNLGCGPGLYDVRLAEKGLKVTGVDISERSLNYATAQAKERGLDIEYRLMNFFDIDYDEEFDAVMQTHGELNTMSDERLASLLASIHRALKAGGLLIFDVTTREDRMKHGLKNNWYVSDGGFWRPGRHLVLEQGFDYPDNNVWLDRYIVVDDGRVCAYHNWFRDHSLLSIRQALQNTGFVVMESWNDLTGTPYAEGGDWIALVAGKSGVNPAMAD